jgi:hypothetical protein
MRGRAILVRDLGGLDPDPVRAAEVYAGWGLEWIMVTGAVGPRAVANDEPAFCRALDLPTWLHWIKPIPEDYRAAPRLFAFAAEIGAQGVCLNPEVEWKGKPEEARRWIASMAALADQAGVKLAITSYARPSFHSTFPWRVFSEVVPLGLPLTYDNRNRFDPSDFTLAAKDYRQAGFSEVIPWGSFWSVDEDRPKAADDLRRHLALVPPTPGIVFWNGGLQSAEARQDAAIVASWRPRPVVPLTASVLLGPFAPHLFGG